MNPYWLVVGVLSVWRVTHLLWAEDGPWDIVARLRRPAGEGFWGRLLDCFYCLSLWTAAPVAGLLGDSWRSRGLLWLAMSGGAILLERLTTRELPVATADHHEDEDTRSEDTQSQGGGNVLLRSPKSEHTDLGSTSPSA